jgi:hypothetical protein
VKEGKGAQIPLSGDQIGDHLILDLRNFVAKPQFAPLHPREQQLVGQRLIGERRNRHIKVAVLDAEQPKPHDKFACIG